MNETDTTIENAFAAPILTIDEAIEHHARSKKAAKDLKEYEDAARKVILAHYATNPEDFERAEDSPTGKTLVIRRGDYKTEVTFPWAAEVPAHFDGTKTSEFRAKLLEAMGDQAAAYFDTVYTLREQRYFDDIKDMEDDEQRAQLHALIAPYVIAKTAPQPLSPRVSSSEVRARKT